MIQLQLETTSTCNAGCRFCVYPSAMRWGGLMSMSLYKKILEEASTIQLITQVTLNGLGEPMLDPHLVDRVKIARTHKPKAGIDIFTNGVYLTPAKFDQLRKAGLTGIAVSLNATSQEQHEAAMGLKDKFTEVCSNIDYAIANSGKVRVEVRAVVDGWSEEDSLKFYDRWGHRDMRGNGQLIHEGNWAGDNRDTRPFKPNETCMRALAHVYVLWDGKVTTCCFDPIGKQVFGDLSKQSLREVYASPEYVSFREAHFNNQADRYEICKGCSRI